MKFFLFWFFISSFSLSAQTSSTKLHVGKTPNREQMMKILIDSIETNFRESYFSAMKKHVTEANKIVLISDSYFYKIKSYKAVSLIYDKSFEDAVQFSRTFLKNKNKMNSSDVIRFEFALSNGLSNLESYQNKEAKKVAIQLHKKLSNNTSPDLKVLKVSNYYLLSNVYYFESKYDSVSIYLDKFRKLLDSDDLNKWADYYTFKSNLEVSRENYYNALILVKRASTLYEKSNNEFKLVYSYYNTADLYRIFKTYDSVFFYFEKAKELAIKSNNTSMRGYISTQLSDVYIDREEYDLAYANLKQSENIFFESKNDHGLAHCLLNLGKIESEYKGNQSKAIDYAERALTLANKIEDGKLIETSYEYLSDFNLKNGDFKKATNYLKLFHEQNLKILSLDVQSTIDSLEVAHKTKLFQEKNKTYKAKISHQENIISSQLKKISVLVFLAIVFAVIAFYIFKNHRKTIKINAISKELDKLKILESRQNEERLVSELKLIQKSLAEKSEINKLLVTEDGNFLDSNQVRHLLSSDGEWLNFILKLKLLFPGFTETLEGLNLNLSINEIRLAAMVRFSLSDKEIADILCIEPGSVKKAKVRLKKKLNVPLDQKLVDYLKEFGN